MYVFFRCISLSPAILNKPKEKPAENDSFVMNVFRGQVESKDVFPYPYILNEEQRETLQMLIDPSTKFFEVTR